MAAVPWTDDPAIQSLRLTYNAAVSAHADCSRALTEATLRGDLPSQAEIDAEAKARARMNNARAQLHVAMTRAIAGANSKTAHVIVDADIKA
jgi:hypothetical protein